MLKICAMLLHVGILDVHVYLNLKQVILCRLICQILYTRKMHLLSPLQQVLPGTLKNI